ncbi:MAG: D-alanine--D-alanine ligase [Myxococcales bacterium]|nr:D-alanine--D-alanine ligase [Myxococcales bacterium]
MGRRRVGVLLGGLSAGPALSPATGEACAEALERLGHDVVRIPVDGDLDRTLRQARLDVAFLTPHGRPGVGGCVQGLLELLRIPYTGSGVLASALATDRLKAKEIFRLHNIPTPPYYALGAAEATRCATLHGSFGFPAVVKPRREGAGGVSIVHDAPELPVAVREALRHDDEVLVERCILGREISVGLLDGRVLGAIEVAPAGERRDRRSKDALDRSDGHLPPRLSPTRCRCVLALAEKANRVLGCAGAARVDLLVTEGDNEYVLGVNPLPGLAPTSLLPRIAAGAGYDYDRLIEAILAGARLHAGTGWETAAPAPPASRAKVLVPARRRAIGGGRHSG